VLRLGLGSRSRHFAANPKKGVMIVSCSIGHPPHSSASPVELRLRVGPRALSEKKEVRYRGVLRFLCPSVRPERSKWEEAWGEKVGNYKIG